MPREKGTFRPADLVEIVSLDPTIKLDIRYATPNNFVGRPVYTEARAFLQRPAAEALVRAHRSVRDKGYGLLVFDGYRPWSVTKLFWDVTPRLKRDFVANPKKGSKHNRGCAVDLSLYDLRTGREVVRLEAGGGVLGGASLADGAVFVGALQKPAGSTLFSDSLGKLPGTVSSWRVP